MAFCALETRPTGEAGLRQSLKSWSGLDEFFAALKQLPMFFFVLTIRKSPNGPQANRRLGGVIQDQ